MWGLGDSVNKYNFNCNPGVLKKIGKTSKRLLFLDPTGAQKGGQYWSRRKWKTNFCAEITKADHKLSKAFYFIKILFVLAVSWIFF